MTMQNSELDLTAVTDFLARIPILQQLPGSSIQKIAESVKIKHFDAGELIVQEGDVGEGMYFVLKGEAEVSPSAGKAMVGPAVLFLRPGDYFGRASRGLVKVNHKADVIAKTEVTCLVLGHEYSSLLAPASIWSSERDASGTSKMEQILQLETLEVDVYRAVTLPDAPTIGHVFGGQFLGQSLAAASKSVDPFLHVHSLHSYFLRTGDVHLPIIYQVHRIRDGHSFAMRHISAYQEGHLIFFMMASFQRTEKGFSHQDMMPGAPDPERLTSVEDMAESYMTDPRIPVEYRNKLIKLKRPVGPLDIRLCDPEDKVKHVAREPRAKIWMRARGTLSADRALHCCVAAYASDFYFLEVSHRPHRAEAGYQLRSLSLDHSMWFHKPFQADEWLLYVINSPVASNARGLVIGKMFNQSGELVVSVAQEGVLRKPNKSKVKPKSKL